MFEKHAKARVVELAREIKMGTPSTIKAASETKSKAIIILYPPSQTIS